MTRRDHGFTLAELLVAMAVSLVVSLAGWSFYRNQLRVLGDQAAGLDAAESARAAMAFMAREIRHAGYDPRGEAFTVDGARGVSDARADRLQIEWDRDGLGSINTTQADPDAESIVYAYDAAGRRIVRTVAGVTQPLIPNVPDDGLRFEYFDEDGIVIPITGTALTAEQRDDVRFVRLRLRVEAETTQASTVELSAKAALRNRILGRL